VRPRLQRVPVRLGERGQSPYSRLCDQRSGLRPSAKTAGNLTGMPGFSAPAAPARQMVTPALKIQDFKRAADESAAVGVTRRLSIRPQNRNGRRPATSPLNKYVHGCNQPFAGQFPGIFSCIYSCIPEIHQLRPVQIRQRRRFVERP